MMPSRLSRLVVIVVVAAFSAVASAQCPEEPPFQNYTGGGQVACPCFVEGEHAGAIFDLPPDEYPIEILKIGIGWGSQFGGTGTSLEDSINIFEGALPDPGQPTYTLEGPELTDGFINEFDIEFTPGDRVIESGPFTVTLRFLNASTLFGPSVVHDGNGCQTGKNIVFDRNVNQWKDGCSLGISGDWVFYVKYRKTDCGASGPGSVPGSQGNPGVPMSCIREANGDLTLDWSPSCSGTDDDYEVYEGSIGSYYSHFSKVCTTGGAETVTITPGSGDKYYLVVPTDGSDEGSYGRDSQGAERPTGGGACHLQAGLSCP